VVYLGDTYHSGGANASAAERWGCNVDYNLALLRQVATALPLSGWLAGWLSV
jgi:hypothetical protein